MHLALIAVLAVCVATPCILGDSYVMQHTEKEAHDAHNPQQQQCSSVVEEDLLYGMLPKEAFDTPHSSSSAPR